MPLPHITDAMKQRRSIRKYSSRTVPKETVKKVLTAAGWAPSAHNAQPWRFIILADPLVKRRLAEAMADSWALDMAKDGIVVNAENRSSRVSRFAGVPVLILACLTIDGMKQHPDEKRQKIERDLAVQSLAASIQNLLLTAHAEGLGACWFAAPSYCKETVRKTMQIPETVEPMALITMGYPAEKPPVPQKKPLGEYCFIDKWQNPMT